MSLSGCHQELESYLIENMIHINYPVTLETTHAKNKISEKRIAVYYTLSRMGLYYWDSREPILSVISSSTKYTTFYRNELWIFAYS